VGVSSSYTVSLGLLPRIAHWPSRGCQIGATV
jgi:hypothetical protein